MQRWVAFTTTAVLVAVLVALVGYWQATRWLATPLELPDEGVEFQIAPGTALATVSAQLAARGVLDRPRLFTWYSRLSGKASAVHAGEYLLQAGTSPEQLLQKFVSGDVRLHSFTIIEGWTFREMLSAMATVEKLQHTLSYEDWPALLAELGADALHPEGMFLPETYRFPAGTTDVDLLRQAHELLRVTLAMEWSERDEDLPLATPYEALILASIIEKETGRADERARIAGVFVRRLQKRMRLQTDPTVIYGIGVDFNGDLTRRDLRTDTPYNTYTRSGLPPTPIALAGRAAIHAALHPEPGKALFFVATGLGDGSHRFSETKEQHDAAVREYLVRLRATGMGK
ncbi:MAG: endolytic transglycosylase MltG [Woeseia sp.]|nr:endolytic transglycosylase MltG [Woeseia sp.]NNE59485.1 endolytic transglycosylase MltG [Woeseia sp.]NNL55643.1 endolytic transglycosylase MltG [Woeseia sp.]